MPKQKTHSGAKKRFNLTKNGKVKRAHAYKSHILNKKSTKRKRGLRKGGYADKSRHQKDDPLQIRTHGENRNSILYGLWEVNRYGTSKRRFGDP